jgi:2-methylcitrate dehydratase PrpD
MNTEVARGLADFAIRLGYDEIPTDVLQSAKSLTLKTITGMIAGSIHPSSKKLSGVIESRKLPQELTVINSGYKSSLWEAVFVNSFYAHVQELEDDRIDGGISWDITVIPTVLSLAEQYGLTGKEFLATLVAGLEVHARTCIFPAGHAGLTVVPGAVGPAAAAARCLGLDVQQTEMAMGLALSSANLSHSNFGTDGHFFESALQSLQAVAAAEMAKAGLTGRPDLDFYLNKLIGEQETLDSRLMLKDLGKRWLFTEIMIKKYPCCFMVHRQVDSLLEVMKENGLRYDDVRSISVYASPADRVCDRPQPESEGDLQFSFQHTLGTALRTGDLLLEDFMLAAASDARLVEARGKVKVHIDENLSGLVMKEPSRIEVELANGRVIPAERKYPIGSLHEPLTVDGLRSVCKKFTKGVLADKKMDEIADAVLGIEGANSVQRLAELLQ